MIEMFKTKFIYKDFDGGTSNGFWASIGLPFLFLFFCLIEMFGTGWFFRLQWRRKEEEAMEEKKEGGSNGGGRKEEEWVSALEEECFYQYAPHVPFTWW